MRTERNINDVLVLDFYDSIAYDYTADNAGNEQEDDKQHIAVSENNDIDIFLAERVLFTQRCLCFSVFVLWIFVLILAFRR